MLLFSTALYIAHFCYVSSASGFQILIKLCNDLRETKLSDLGSVGQNSYTIGLSMLLSMHDILPQYIVTHSGSPIIYGANISNPLDVVAGIFPET